MAKVCVSHQFSKDCWVKLGIFNAIDDHGSLEMQCPACDRWVEISSQALMFPGDNGYLEMGELRYIEVPE